MNIRILSEKELPIVKDLAYKIWPISYQDILLKDQMDYMLNWMYSIEKLEQDFQAGHVFFCISENGVDLGFLEAQIHHPEKGSMKIQKIYVLPEFHGKGIGFKLLNEAKSLANSQNLKSIFLQVNRNNEAVNFYLRNGFKIIDEQDFDIGKGFYMNDFIMQYSLNT